LNFAGRSAILSMRLAIASVITKNAYVAMLLAWVHSVAQQLSLDPTVQADVLLVHCDADVSTLRTMATCVHERSPTVRVRLIEGCVQAPSRLHPHFVSAVKWNTGHARFLNVWSIYHLWSLTQVTARTARASARPQPRGARGRERGGALQL
jgi:hypothetical protein